jgi:hypothetical protein
MQESNTTGGIIITEILSVFTSYVINYFKISFYIIEYIIVLICVELVSLTTFPKN